MLVVSFVPRPRSRSMIACLLLVSALAAVPVAAQDAAPSAFQPLVEAYRNTSTIHATIAFQQAERQGRWELSRRTTFTIAYDRAANRLMVDKPEIRLVVEGGVLRASSPRFRGRHLEIEIPTPLTYPELMAAMPALAQPKLPDLLLLLGEDPSVHDPNSRSETVEPDPDDPEKLPGIMLATSEYRLIARHQPPSYLPQVTAIRWNPRVFNRPDSDVIQAVHRMQVHQHNEPLDDEVFKFDTSGSRAVATMAELAGKHRLEGNPAPPMALDTLDGDLFRLTETEHPFVLIGFWATWYPGWEREVQVMQRLHDWAKQEQMPLTVVTVNVNDAAETVRDKVGEAKLSMPVLLGTGKDVVKSYDAAQLPRSVLIVQGRIARVFEGIEPVEAGLKQMLQQQKQAGAGTESNE